MDTVVLREQGQHFREFMGDWTASILFTLGKWWTKVSGSRPGHQRLFSMQLILKLGDFELRSIQLCNRLKSMLLQSTFSHILHPVLYFLLCNIHGTSMKRVKGVEYLWCRGLYVNSVHFIFWCYVIENNLSVGYILYCKESWTWKINFLKQQIKYLSCIVFFFFFWRGRQKN